METKNNRQYPKAFEESYATWDEETKKLAACVGWSIAMETAIELIRKMSKKGDKHGDQK